MAVVKYKTNLHRPRLGVCSNWLASFTGSDLKHRKIRLWVTKGSITLPKDPEIPIIMVGPGMFFIFPLFPYSLIFLFFYSLSFHVAAFSF